jgi:AAHS family 4-hydroxybenzoate transporter-like MFS transporter
MSSDLTPTQSVQAVLDRTGLTWRHWLYFALIFLILLADGMDVTIVSHVFPSLIKEWGVTIGGGIALVVSGGFIAMGIGALAGGRAADRVGRKNLLVGATVLFSVTTALGATSQDFTTFVIWRLIACLGIGAVMPIGMTLLADLVPARRRAAMITAAYAGVGLGVTAGATLAGLIIPTSGWRTLLLAAGAIPLVIGLVLAVVVPESPAFYIGRGAVDKARRILARIAPGTDIETIDTTPSADALDRGALRVILTKPFTLTTVLLWVFGFFSLGTQLLIAQYLPTLLQQPTPGLDTVQSSTIVASYGFASVIGGLLLSVILARFSRYAVIGFTLGIGAIVAVIVALQADAGFGILLPLLTLAGFVLPAGFGPTRNVLATAAYPVRVRGTGVGATELAGRVGSALGGAAGGSLIGAGLGLGGVFLVVLVPIAALLAALFGLQADAKRQGTAGAQGFSDNESPAASLVGAGID